jgi:hypothetical protein
MSLVVELVMIVRKQYLPGPFNVYLFIEQFLFYEKLWIGAMYRWQDAAGVLLQYEIDNRFKIGYAFDYTLSNLSIYSNGSHEIMLGIDIGRKWAGDVSPRFFSTRYF